MRERGEDERGIAQRHVVAAAVAAAVAAVAGVAPAKLVPVKLTAEQASRLMDEALICLRERSNGKLVSAFFDIARGLAQTGK